MTSNTAAAKPTLTELADALEEEQLRQLLILKSALYTMGEVDPKRASRLGVAAAGIAHADGR